jgi:hypothetical protein
MWMTNVVLRKSVRGWIAKPRICPQQNYGTLTKVCFKFCVETRLSVPIPAVGCLNQVLSLSSPVVASSPKNHFCPRSTKNLSRQGGQGGLLVYYIGLRIAIVCHCEA